MSNSFEKKFTLLCEWIRNNGGFVSEKIQIDGTSENRHIYALEDINENEKLIEIPKKCCISKDNISEIPDIKTIELSNLNDKGLLVTVLLYNMKLGKNSFFYPYIKLLPKYHDYSYHPIFGFDAKAKERYAALSPAFALSIESIIKDIQNIADILSKPNAVFTEDDVIYENIELCYLIALSRQWGQGLVPVADLFQHSNESNIILNINNTMSTVNKIKGGEIIYDNYGKKSDMHMLAIYGFVDNIEDNTKQRIYEVSLNMIESKDNFNNLKNTLIKNFLDSHKLFFLTRNGIQNDMIYLMRLATLSERDFRFVDYNTNFFEKSISIDNECTTYKNLLNIIKQHSDKITEQEIENSKNIIKSGLTNTIEYKIAKIILMQKNIFDENAKLIITAWNNLLGSQIKYEIKLN
jgi:hypothetical protein